MSMMKWKANLTSDLGQAIISKNKKRNYIIAFYGKRLSSILPDWNIYCNEEIISRDFNSFWGLIRDTLYEYQPNIRIAYNTDYVTSSCFTAKGKIKGFLFSSEDIAYIDGPRKYYLHLNIELDRGEYLPDKIENINITIDSEQLPEERYSYQYCNKFDARNLPCDFIQYLRVVGTPQGDKGVNSNNCRLFRLEKGNPHQYCSFLLGT